MMFISSVLHTVTKNFHTKREPLPVSNFDGIHNLATCDLERYEKDCGVCLLRRFDLCQFGVSIHHDNDELTTMHGPGIASEYVYANVFNSFILEKESRLPLFPSMCSDLCSWAAITDRGEHITSHVRWEQRFSQKAVHLTFALMAAWSGNITEVREALVQFFRGLAVIPQLKRKLVLKGGAIIRISALRDYGLRKCRYSAFPLSVISANMEIFEIKGTNGSSGPYMVSSLRSNVKSTHAR